MAPDETPATALAPPTSATGVGPTHSLNKVRIRFRKAGSLRLLSHHDLMRTFERMLRRAALPVRQTQGFHPKPRLVFALSLPLGVVGAGEVVELELNAELPPEEIHERLARQAPLGLEIHDVRPIAPRATARVRGLSYGLAIPAEQVADLRPRMGQLLAAQQCRVERTRPEVRHIDLRPFLRDLRLEESNTPSRFTLIMDLFLTDAGTARPEEVVRLLDLYDLIESGAVLERTRLELEDELPPPASPAARDAADPAAGATEPEKVSHET